MRYLVTGCAGFIASRTTELLLEGGHEVVGIDNMNDAYDPQLKAHRLERLEGQDRFKFHQLDIADRHAVAPLFEDGGYDAVINLAARAGVRQSLENPWIYLDTNTTGTLNLLEQCRLHDVGQFLVASTSSLYGAHNALPFSEDDNTERPLSPYAASKKGAESMAASYSHLYGINVAVPRYFTVYGPAGRPDMSVFRFIKWISEGTPIVLYGDGGQSRDFTYVDDIARGTTLAATKVEGFEIINLGGDEPHSISEMIACVEDLVGKKAVIDSRPFHKADVKATWANVSKAERILGWKAVVGFEEGLRKTVDWHKANANWIQKVSTGAD